MPAHLHLLPYPDGRRGIDDGQGLRLERFAFFAIEDRNVGHAYCVVGNSGVGEIPMLAGTGLELQIRQASLRSGSETRCGRPRP